MERTRIDKDVADESTKIQKSIHIQTEVENLYDNKSKTLCYVINSVAQLFALMITALIT